MQLLRTIATSVIAGVLALPTLASPLTTRQTTTDTCAGLGPDALSTLPSTFTLAALNTTLPNTNSTGAPMVVFGGLSGHGWTEYWFVPWGSNKYPSQPGVFTLDSGTLKSGQAVSVPVNSGNRLTLGSSAPYPTTPTPAYCAAPPSTPGGFRQLAVNGHTDKFTLCPNGPDFVTITFYDYTGKSYYGYDCYPVTLQIVPQ